MAGVAGMVGMKLVPAHGAKTPGVRAHGVSDQLGKGKQSLKQRKLLLEIKEVGGKVEAGETGLGDILHQVAGHGASNQPGHHLGTKEVGEIVLSLLKKLLTSHRSVQAGQKATLRVNGLR
eukprot:TRINITY_DN98673_c0_g1_i1.p2 TRINITY_DN98673_c0_g1~~TRINITY_DN98673_c0_g1_i1.p2  ORF type:complete len:120 (-),score=34.67 TRINITY_DN98673_c0_g1_i1:19-378(-)